MRDFVRAALRIADCVDNELVIIGCGYEHTIREFAGLICQHAGFDAGQIVYDTSKYVGAKSKCLDISKLKRLQPDFSPTPLAEGVPAVIDWMHEYYLKRSLK